MYTKLALAVAISLILGVTISSASAHYYDDSKIKTVDDIVNYCEFFYDEYKRFGERNLYLQHNYEPKLRFCVKLYSHIVWPTDHPDRNRILVSEITKMIGSSGYIKERHLGLPNVNHSVEHKSYFYGVKLRLVLSCCSEVTAT